MDKLSREREPKKTPEQELSEREEAEFLTSLLETGIVANNGEEEPEVPCMDRIALIKYQKHLLSKNKREEVDRHIKECEKCRTVLARLRESRKTFSDIGLEISNLAGKQ